MIKPLHILSRVVMAVSGIVFVGALVASGVFFSGFLGGGRSWVAILQAFVLCFGLGAMLYLPAAILFFMSKYVWQSGPRLSISIAAICISLPLVLYGVFGAITNMPYILLTLAVLTYGLLILLWGICAAWIVKHPTP